MLKTCEKIDNTIQQNPNASNETLLNLTDPDCRVMKSDSTTKECFNAQIITNNQRGCEVEPVFGQMTYNHSFNRFRLRGLDSVKGEFMITALAHNLGKIMRYQAKNTKNKEVLSNSS